MNALDRCVRGHIGKNFPEESFLLSPPSSLAAASAINAISMHTNYPLISDLPIHQPVQQFLLGRVQSLPDHFCILRYYSLQMPTRALYLRFPMLKDLTHYIPLNVVMLNALCLHALCPQCLFKKSMCAQKHVTSHEENKSLKTKKSVERK